jgi:uncharacterized membrane protein YgcG
MEILMNSKRIAFLTAVGAVVLTTAACQHDSTPVNHGEKFTPEVEVRETTTLEQTEKAAGAREDATFYPQHFDGPGLSSLGTTKLDMMLADSHSANPMVVYMAVPSDSQSQDRRDAVSRYLQDRGGLKADQIKFQDGPNPDTYHPAEADLKNYDKTDTGNETASPGTSAASGGSSGGGSSGH